MLTQERFTLDLRDCACTPTTTETDCEASGTVCVSGACVSAGESCSQDSECAGETGTCTGETLLLSNETCDTTIGRCITRERQERCDDAGLRCWEDACISESSACPEASCNPEPFAGQCDPDERWRAEVERLDLNTCTCEVESIEVLCDLDERCDDDLGCALDCAEPCDESRLEEPRCEGSVAILQTSVQRDEVSCACEVEEEAEDCALDGLRCEEGACVPWDD